VLFADGLPTDQDAIMDSATAALLAEAVGLHRQGMLAEAAERYAQVLRNEPANADVLYALAQIACHQGRFAEGVDFSQRALAIDPQRARAHNLLGMALARLGQREAALASFDAAIACAPELADAHGNRGDVLAELGRPAEAIASYDRALRIFPDSIETWCNCGAALYDLGRYVDALASYDRAIALKPDFADVHFNRGNALNRLARYEKALLAYERALALRPDHVEALFDRGGILVKFERHGEAIACYERVLAIAPHHPEAADELANCHLLICDWTKTALFARTFSDRIADSRSVISPFTLLGFPATAADLLKCSERFVANKLKKLPKAPPARTADHGGRIRLAYLSADFRHHATAYLVAELFELHDRDRFDVIGISFGRDDRSEVRARLMRAFDRFHDVASTSNRAVVSLLQELEVDIAVDLKGHTEGARLAILAARPAPLQVSYLGYPGTMGVDFIDYVIADGIVLPVDQQPFYPEKIVHLPDSYQVNDSKRRIASRVPTRRELGLPDHGFVFCCFNNNWKINAAMFDIWMRLLAAVDGSVLWLFRSNDLAMVNLRAEAKARGIDPARLVFAPFLDLPDHLARLKRAELFLDTLPCNAHTTTSDALWAGLPVLTCIGDTFAGRVAASLLNGVGLPELVTNGLDEYEALALRLARDRPLLESIRRKLEQNRLSSPLFDTDRFRRHIEAAYATMWEMHRRGESPRSFRVDPIER
jgi:predicted O-linked N-acetylglucosamine transferase (SPINDLY family)